MKHKDDGDWMITGVMIMFFLLLCAFGFLIYKSTLL